MKRAVGNSKTIVISLGGSIISPEFGKIDINFLKKFRKLILKFLKKRFKFIIIVGGGKNLSSLSINRLKDC